MTFPLSPLIAAGVILSTAATDAVYVMFNAAVTARSPAKAASWSALWYLLAAFAVISYTGNPIYALFAAAGSWIGAFCSVRWLNRSKTKLEIKNPLDLEVEPLVPNPNPEWAITCSSSSSSRSASDDVSQVRGAGGRRAARLGQ